MRLTLVLAIVASLCLVGCGSTEPAKEGYEKKAFEKTGPPPEYKGPGQAGAPSSGPISGPGG